MKTEEDKNKLKHFKADIFNKAIPIITTLRKYFKFTNDIKTTRNIAFKNETCCSVSQTIRRLLDKQAEYEIDETLICRKYYKTKAIKFSVNFEYKIVGVGPKYLMFAKIVILAKYFSKTITLIRTIAKFIHIIRFIPCHTN